MVFVDDADFIFMLWRLYLLTNYVESSNIHKVHSIGKFPNWQVLVTIVMEKVPNCVIFLGDYERVVNSDNIIKIIKPNLLLISFLFRCSECFDLEIWQKTAFWFISKLRG